MHYHNFRYGEEMSLSLLLLTYAQSQITPIHQQKKGDVG